MVKIERLGKMMKGQNVAPKNKKKIAPRGPGSSESLMRAVNRFLDKKEGDGTKKITGFHPSYGYSCKRRWVLLFRGAEYEKKFNDRTQRIFDNGHAVHDRWRKYFEDMGILVEGEVEVKINDPVPIRGHADGILDWNGHRLYELKSINSNRFEFRRMYKKPDEKTYLQAQMYLYSLNLNVGIVIYENKNTQEVLMFEIEKDDAVIQKELRRLTKIYNMYKEDKLPARPYKRESDNCSQCDLERYCWDKLDD